MASFAKPSFPTSKYASDRPTYPQELYQFLYNFHKKSGKAGWDRAIDLGCGTGQVLTELTPFKQVYGVDASDVMLAEAKKTVEKLSLPQQVRFVKSTAENLAYFKDGSVDMIFSGQAAHWFNYDELWTELARILKPNGSFALWGYSEFRSPKYPSLTPIVVEYMLGTDPENTLGQYWQQPGRRILDNHFLDVPPPSEKDFADWQLIITGPHYPNITDSKPVIMKKRISWKGLDAYCRTMSGYHTYQEQNPLDASRQNIGDGDIIQRFIKRLKDGIRAVGDEPGEYLDIDWPVAIMMARRK
ncbi:S-adenosyl-L-methionine-dependent methyltransferase [Sistotremastrum niveocremeum HHB9708]|uniref:S-adenosyl-L-methionine-dependent methyltransferase n=1 Tax=Sistotremastrum niveocremeum HHB9708 TaxID=1314777 RepID=A0A164R0I6_9AGAM|nr:S-adenosyl-L-methionine-dependent methyltransferase [Sistotremastrum niveocremeum HHB9708]